MPDEVGRIRDQLLGGDSFLPPFMSAIVIIFLTPLIDESFVGRMVSLLLLVATLILALQRSHIRRPAMVRLSSIMAAAVVASGVAGVLSDRGQSPQALDALVAGAFVVVIAIALPAILNHTLLHSVVSLNTLAGVMTAYLLIGLLFTGVFRFVDIVGSEPFFAQTTTPDTGDFEYFSFITITTTGYGDLTPRTQAGRSAALTEAVTGQIFLVTVVARVVGLLGGPKHRLAPTEDEEDGGPDPEPPPSGDPPSGQ